MQLSVLARASTQNLVTLARARRIVDDSTAYDAVLAALIVEASSAIAGYLGRGDLARQKYRLAFAGCNERIVLLPRYPVDRDRITATIDDEAVTDFTLLDPAIGKLYRASGWTSPLDADAPLNNVVDFYAGYVLPDMVREWAVSLTLAAGDWIKPTSPSLSPYLFEVTVGGATGSGSEPTWSTAADRGDAITVGTATAVARDAEELPALLSSLAYVEVFNRYAGGTRAPGLASQSGEGFSESYFATQTDSDLCAPVRVGLDRMRAMVA